MDQQNIELSVPQKAWYGDSHFKVEIPWDWKVEICRMAGEKKKAMTDRQIRMVHPFMTRIYWPWVCIYNKSLRLP